MTAFTESVWVRSFFRTNFLYAVDGRIKIWYDTQEQMFAKAVIIFSFHKALTFKKIVIQ